MPSASARAKPVIGLYRAVWNLAFQASFLSLPERCAETLITEHISLRGEYRFTDLGSGQLGLPTINDTDMNDFVIAHAAPTMQDGRVSVNYRF
jgi:hypothetical protein